MSLISSSFFLVVLVFSFFRGVVRGNRSPPNAAQRLTEPAPCSSSLLASRLWATAREGSGREHACTGAHVQALGDAGEVAPSPDACLRMSGSELLFHWHKSQEEPTV